MHEQSYGRKIVGLLPSRSRAPDRPWAGPSLLAVKAEGILPCVFEHRVSFLTLNIHFVGFSESLASETYVLVSAIQHMGTPVLLGPCYAVSGVPTLVTTYGGSWTEAFIR